MACMMSGTAPGSLSSAVISRAAARTSPLRARSISSASSRFGNGLFEEGDDVGPAGAGQEDFADALLFEPADIGGRDDAAAEQDHVIHVLLAHQPRGLAENVLVRGREDADTDGVGVLLEAGIHDRLGRLV